MSTKVASRVTNITVATIALEDDITSYSLDITQETPDVTALDNTGPRRVTGNYDFGLSLDAALDFASGQSDATIFALIGSAGAAITVDPTGVSAAANEPNYDSTMVLQSYSIKGAVGAAVTGNAKLAGNSALTRAVA